MKVKITGSISPIPAVASMWYANHIGEVFEVVDDPKYSDMFLTVEPIYKKHCGHIKKSDCEVIQ